MTARKSAPGTKPVAKKADGKKTATAKRQAATKAAPKKQAATKKTPAADRGRAPAASRVAAKPDAPKQSYGRLLDYLRHARGTDLRSYKTGSLFRRIERRMSAVGIQGQDEYMDYLDVHPEEFDALFDTILINVTSFFRDPQTWEYVREHIIPRIVEAREGHPIRIWSAGCASGEEAYTLAMLIAEAVGEQRFRDDVKIFATDLDEDALNVARHGRYPPQSLDTVPDALRKRYFEKSNSTVAFAGDLRHNIIFGKHDLTKDAPIRNVDLLVCRNTLMYLNAEAQALIATRMHFALRDTGFLLLGRAEGLFSHSDLFLPVSAEHRVFSRVSNANVRERLLRLVRLGSADGDGDPEVGQALTESAMNALPLAQLIVSVDGVLTSANSKARATLGIVPTDVGRPLHELEVSFRPVELRSLISKAMETSQPARVAGAERHLPDGSVQFFDVEVHPLLDGGMPLGTSIAYTDITNHLTLEEDLRRSKQELEAAYEELQSTNEELETTNEELQSTIEELETTNEELQSTNEELETMNEELQSTNEELQTLNDELGLRTADVDQTNAFLESILHSLESGVIVVDPRGNVLRWNRRSEDLWGLRADEVQGQSVFGLDIGLPVEILRKPIRTAITGDAPEDVGVDARNRRGQPIHIRISSSPLVGPAGDAFGVILLLKEEDGAA